MGSVEVSQHECFSDSGMQGAFLSTHGWMKGHVSLLLGEWGGCLSTPGWIRGHASILLSGWRSMSQYSCVDAGHVSALLDGWGGVSPLSQQGWGLELSGESEGKKDIAYLPQRSPQMCVCVCDFHVLPIRNHFSEWTWSLKGRNHKLTSTFSKTSYSTLTSFKIGISFPPHTYTLTHIWTLSSIYLLLTVWSQGHSHYIEDIILTNPHPLFLWWRRYGSFWCIYLWASTWSFCALSSPFHKWGIHEHWKAVKKIK